MPTYLTHGFRIETSWALPSGVQECTSGTGPGCLQVRPASLSWPPVEQAEQELFCVDSEGRHLLYWPILGAVRIDPGGLAEIDVRADAPDGIVPHAILGPVAAHWILMGGKIALHANCVMAPGGLLAVVGPSGAGKSSLAAAMTARGAAPHCDDIVSVHPRTAQVPFGSARIKLNSDVLERVSIAPLGVTPLYAGLEKRGVELKMPPDLSDRPLKAIYGIRDAATAAPPTINEVGGFPMAMSVMSEVYRPHVAAKLFGVEEILRRCSSLVGKVRFFELARHRDLAQVDDLARVVLQHFQGLD